MHLLLVSATEFEISETISWLNKHSQSHNGSTTELLISGIGQLQTAYSLEKKIMEHRPYLVIQAGIGGSHSAQDIGKTFAIRSEVMGDLGVMEKKGFLNLFELGLDSPGRFPFKGGKLKNPYHSLLEWTGLPMIDGFTVNEIKSADFMEGQRNPSPVVESMEGAALHYVCLMEKIPFLQIRSVSNLIGDRDKNRWKLNEARKSLFESLSLLIKKLEKADENLFRIQSLSQ
jgi:futalosine hydrolase